MEFPAVQDNKLPIFRSFFFFFIVIDLSDFLTVFSACPCDCCLVLRISRNTTIPNLHVRNSQFPEDFLHVHVTGCIVK